MFFCFFDLETNEALPTKMSKVKTFISTHLTATGTSTMIRRYDLPAPWAYTSGDGIFRSDSTLGRKHKFCRFGAKFDGYRRISQAWRLCITDGETKMLEKEHSTLIFPEKPGVAVHYIKFYGHAPPIVNEGIRRDIVKAITALPCASCGTSTGIECDHKNDLWIYNDQRIGYKEQQLLGDFQPLCKHCNDVKRAVLARTNNEQKRQPAPGFPHMPFSKGSSTFDKTDPYWYVGTYWGDVQAFKNACCKKMRLVIKKSD
jgi:hypothetical protein